MHHPPQAALLSFMSASHSLRSVVGTKPIFLIYQTRALLGRTRAIHCVAAPQGELRMQVSLTSLPAVSMGQVTAFLELLHEEAASHNLKSSESVLAIQFNSADRFYSYLQCAANESWSM